MTRRMLDDTHTFAFAEPCDYGPELAHILLPDGYGDRRSCGLAAHVQAMYDAHAFDAMMTKAVDEGRATAIRGSDGRWHGQHLDEMPVQRWHE